MNIKNYLFLLISLLYITSSFSQKETNSEIKIEGLIEFIKNHKEVFISSENNYKEFNLDLQNYSYKMFEGYFENGNIKDIEIYADNNFIFYKEFNNIGKITTFIDYFASKIVIGKKPKLYDLYLKCKIKADSLVSKHFKPEIAKNIKLNIDFSSWIKNNDEKSGTNLFENIKEMPKGVELIYSYNENNTIIYELLKIRIRINNSIIGIIEHEGIPNNENDITVSYKNAQRIVNKHGYFITDYNISNLYYGRLMLEFNDELKKYFWVISKISKKEIIHPKNSTCGYYKLKGKTIRINANNGKIKESKIDQPMISMYFY